MCGASGRASRALGEHVLTQAHAVDYIYKALFTTELEWTGPGPGLEEEG